jgi:uncharacterized protein (DUF2141 family)
MKYLILFSTFYYFTFQQNKNVSSVLVKIEGINENKGQIIINLYKNRNGFPTKPELSYKQFIVPIENLKSEFLIENLEKGEYAISAFQDENSNGKFDVNFFSMPIEKVGCSNNPNALFIPSYDDAKFQLNEKQKVISITIK